MIQTKHKPHYKKREREIYSHLKTCRKCGNVFITAFRFSKVCDECKETKAVNYGNTRDSN